ncbi:MAG: hypothetical protein WBP29_03895 [Candidatus Zixiibacteriota bacterium]
MKRPLVILYVVTLIAIVYCLIAGFNYYNTPYTERPHHEDYRQLRPAGSRGIAYGYIGAAMMILMLTYSLRKRTKLLGKKITLRNWLKLHIYLGVCGPLFIILHSSFKVQGLIAVAFWSMVAVAISGYLGRYLYIQIPRNQEGDELSLSEIDKQMLQSTLTLQEQFDLQPEQLAHIDTLAKRGTGAESSFLTLLIRMFISDLTRPFATSKLTRELKKTVKVSDKSAKLIVKLALERSALARRIEMLDRTREVFHYWHVIHKPFAIIMYLIMGIHIGVAVWTGFSGLS